MEGESGYYADGMCVSDRYDYDNEYMGDGVLYLRSLRRGDFAFEFVISYFTIKLIETARSNKLDWKKYFLLL